MTRRWILGALVYSFFPSAVGVTVRRITNFLTSSFLSKLKNLRMLVARLGPSLLGLTTSVMPGSSPSPCLTMERAMTARSRPVMAAVLG